MMVERYPLEMFTFEILIGLVIAPSFRLTAFLLAGACLTAVLSEGLKLFFREKRPEEALKRNFYRRTFRLNRRSFPSSHSAIAAFFPAFFYGSVLFVPFLAFSVAVMYSRIYIKSHYPRDVAAGAVIGASAGLASAWLMMHPWI